nr:hypothetical protein Iba_chr14aCG6650 [Ipomoea batatas]
MCWMKHTDGGCRGMKRSLWMPQLVLWHSEYCEQMATASLQVLYLNFWTRVSTVLLVDVQRMHMLYWISIKH